MDSALRKITYAVVSIALMGGLLGATSDAYAQAASCRQLGNSLNSLNRDTNFRNLNTNTKKARQVRDSLRKSESKFVRDGCQRALKAKQTLTRECRSLGRSILNGREDYNEIARDIETGQEVAQQREVTLQQIARFGCRANNSNNRSNTRVNLEQESQNESPFGNLLNRLFGGGNNIRDDYAPDYFNQTTLRTVCVRSCDGYYWPISFSTVDEFLGTDAASCQAQAGASDAELYYYNNPGEDADTMVNLNGVPYKSHPNAFLYRREFSSECRTKPVEDFGRIEVISVEDGGRGQATIVFADKTIPLPQRDPRRKTKITVTQASFVPLPRPRPAREGEQVGDSTIAKPIIATRSQTDRRVIISGDRPVRIVGPDTPYVQAAGGES